MAFSVSLWAVIFGILPLFVCVRVCVFVCANTYLCEHLQLLLSGIGRRQWRQVFPQWFSILSLSLLLLLLLLVVLITGSLTKPGVQYLARLAGQ